MPTMKKSDNGEMMFEDVRIIFRNFAGEERQYNREGDRNFALVLTEEMAEVLEREGWNVKRKPPREEGEPEFIFISVKVSFKGRPPRLVMITKSQNRRTTLDEETCDLFDQAEFDSIDLIVRPYAWTVNGSNGVTAYLKAIYGTLHEDELELKYAEYRDERMTVVEFSDEIVEDNIDDPWPTDSKVSFSK
jgi:hypothetical protein